MSSQRFLWTKSVQQVEKSIHKFHEEKNEHAINFPNKIQHTLSSTNKKSVHIISKNKISFTRRKTNVKVSIRYKSTCKKFPEQNQNATSSTNKNQRNKIREQNQFHEEKN